MCALAAAAEHLHNHQSATKMWGFDSGELWFLYKKKKKVTLKSSMFVLMVLIKKTDSFF